MINSLEMYCLEVLGQTEVTRDNIRTLRTDKGYIRNKQFLENLLSEIPGIGDFEAEFITRSEFGADIMFKSTKLLREDKDAYFKKACPELVEKLNSNRFFESAEQKGIYVNAKLDKSCLFKGLSEILIKKGRYGESAIGEGKDIVIDYSSPNAAKHLHAGHIRSTIIGHILGNIYEANGYTVHRINYLNDWGGVGFLMEGLERWQSKLPDFENKNDLLFAIYSAFRRFQKIAESEQEYSQLSEDDKNELRYLHGDFADHEEFKELFKDYKDESDLRFKNLEVGKEEEFIIWRKIVEWSLADFEKFYDILGIHLDYLLGESIFSGQGRRLVNEEMEKGNVVKFDEKMAEEEIAKIRKEIEDGNIKQDSGELMIQEVKADVGGYVIMLDDFERFVVLKGNESTIYATRDLASLKYRIDNFNPSQALYEVGQEQREHFDKLFKSAKKLGFGEGISMKHIFHGFYVSEETKKKLSSRDGASNIMKLLHDTIDYFYNKYNGNDEFTEDEKKYIAHSLGVGSVIYNDIRKDKKTSISISSNPETMFLQFEESGGAYIIYASCRAKSILRKYGKELPNVNEVVAADLNDAEIDIMKKLLEFPNAVERACREDDPVRITEYLYRLALAFNSYYNAYPVLKGDFPHRLILTKTVAQILDNGLKLLHVNPLDRI